MKITEKGKNDRRVVVREDEHKRLLIDEKVIDSKWEIACKKNKKSLTSEDQISLVSDAMFMTMFQTESRKCDNL